MTRAIASLLLLVASSVASAGEVELSYGQDYLTRGRSGWRALSLETAWTAEDRSGASLAVRELERYDLRDLDVGATGQLTLGHGWDVGVEASASPSHEFVPLVTAGAQVQYAAGAGFVGMAGARWSRYQADAFSTDTTLGRFGVERYWGRFRVGWVGYLATLGGSWSFSQRLAGDVYYGRGGRVGLGVAVGEELESMGNAQLLRSRVVSVGLSGRQALGDDWAITYEAGVQQQGDFYTRSGARIGLRRHF